MTVVIHLLNIHKTHTFCHMTWKLTCMRKNLPVQSILFINDPMALSIIFCIYFKSVSVAIWKCNCEVNWWNGSSFFMANFTLHPYHLTLKETVKLKPSKICRISNILLTSQATRHRNAKCSKNVPQCLGEGSQRSQMSFTLSLSWIRKLPMPDMLFHLCNPYLVMTQFKCLTWFITFVGLPQREIG